MTRLILRPWLLMAVTAFTAASAGAQLVPEDAIRAGYELFYQGKAQAAGEHFRAIIGRAPENLPAQCGLASMVLARVDEGEQALEKELESLLDRLLVKAQERHDRNSRDREALLYLAQGYMLRARYKFSHNKGVWGAARDAAKSKHFAEQYVKLDGHAVDGELPLGMYNYYVEIAPSFVKVFRTLLFLSAGDRREGLRQVEHVAREGKLLATLAQMELMDIYRLEGRQEDAARAGQELAKRYPENLDVQLRLANLYGSTALEDYEAAARQFAAVAEHARGGNSNYLLTRRYRAMMGLAATRMQQWRLDEAMATLNPVIQERVSNPDWVLPRYLLARGNYRLLLNEDKAVEDARAVQAEPKWKRWHEAAARQIKSIEERRRNGEAAVYAALIPGNRLVVERRWEEAAQAYQRIRQQYPDDAQVRFRAAWLDFQRGELERSASGFRQVVDGPKAQAWIKAGSLLYLARIADLRQQRQEALKLYKRIVDDYEHESAAGAARAGLIAPYRRRA